ncbi:MAG: VCBS repeat-containing protein, partial [Gammaproteobacteria bacterium]|nr:VCBS repeat-containing protein [Gammaproteobacteria bacterium]
MSGGVALLDFDVDGDLDVFLVQGGYLGEAELDSPPPTLFENQLTDGLLMFKDVSGSSGLRHDSYGMGAAIGDIDGDLDPDIYVTAYGSNSLFRNDGGGRFTKLAVAGDDRWSSSAAFFDYDRDGRLDLLVVNYVSFDVNFNKTCFSAARDYCSPLTYKPVPDALYQNADGTFVDVSNRAGLDAVYGSGLGVVIVDINNDQWLDVYVANDGLANQLWINEQGQLSDQGLSLGAAYNGEGMPEAGMPSP